MNQEKKHLSTDMVFLYCTTVLHLTSLSFSFYVFFYLTHTTDSLSECINPEIVLAFGKIDRFCQLAFYLNKISVLNTCIEVQYKFSFKLINHKRMLSLSAKLKTLHCPPTKRYRHPLSSFVKNAT